MKKKIDLELYLTNELTAWKDSDQKDFEYGSWIIKKLAVVYAELHDVSRFNELKSLYGSLHPGNNHRKAFLHLGQYLTDLEEMAFSENIPYEELLSGLMDEGGITFDNPDEFFQGALDFTSIACGFLSDEYITILEYYVQMMIKEERYYEMIEFLDALIERLDALKLGDDYLFILMGYKVSLLLGIDMESACQLEKERIVLCEKSLIGDGDAKILAKEISTYLQLLSMNNLKDDFLSVLKSYCNCKTFKDEELLCILEGVCLSFDMHRYDYEIEQIICPCVENICKNNVIDSDMYLSARRALINFYSLTHKLDIVEEYLNEDLVPTKSLYGRKSIEYRTLIESALAISRDKHDGDASLKYIKLIRSSGWADDDKTYSCVLLLYEADAYFDNHEYEKSRKLGLLSMFQFMLLPDDASTQWVEALEIVAKCERADGKLEDARKHYENILEESLRIFGPDDSFVMMISDELESF